MANQDSQPGQAAERQAVIRRELEWHEHEASRRVGLDKLLYDPPAFDKVVESGLTFLQGQPDEKVLELGCGEGKEVLALAQQGLCVIGVDLSRAQLSRAWELVQSVYPASQMHLVQANAEQLPFVDSSFRIIYGKAILHHLDLDVAAAETRRLLRAGGRVTFAEPLSHHPMFWLARKLTPQLRTRDERPFPLSSFSRFAAPIGNWQSETAFLFAPLAYPIRRLRGGERLFRRVHAGLQRIDNWLLRHIPALSRLAWYGIVKVQKADR